MNRLIRFVSLFLLALTIVPFLPLYLERTLLRSFRMGSAGDKIDWGWKIVSLWGYWADYTYMTREQRPLFWLQVDIGLAIFYALLFAFALDRVLVWRRKRRNARTQLAT